jgi:hypothetical protein
VVIPDTGHFIAEESPRELLEVLGPFLAPYRDAAVPLAVSSPRGGGAPG